MLDQMLYVNVLDVTKINVNKFFKNEINNVNLI